MFDRANEYYVFSLFLFIVISCLELNLYTSLICFNNVMKQLEFAVIAEK